MKITSTKQTIEKIIVSQPEIILVVGEDLKKIANPKLVDQLYSLYQEGREEVAQEIEDILYDGKVVDKAKVIDEYIDELLSTLGKGGDNEKK